MRDKVRIGAGENAEIVHEIARALAEQAHVAFVSRDDRCYGRLASD